MSLYLDHAATSYPKDPRVVRAMVDALERVGVAPARGSSRRTAAADRILEQARVLAARLFSVPSPERITFTLNATDALNLAIKGMVREGDEVVSSQIDHNSVTRPIRGLARRHSVTVRSVAANQVGFIEPRALLEVVTDRTRLVVLTHASNVTGTLQAAGDLGSALRARWPRARLLVDVAQTAGHRLLDDVANVADAIAGSGHKGPGGPLGTGILWVREGIEVSPLREGGTGTHSDVPDQPAEYPGALEAGSANLPGIAALAEAMRIALDEIGLDAIRARRERATQRFLHGIAAIPGLECFGPGVAAEREPVFPIRVRGLSVEEASLLLEQQFGVEQRAGLHCAPGMHRALGTFPDGTLRISFGSLVTDDEVDRAISALSMLATSAP